ncbi:MAG: acyl--CoA ligase, partial [Acidimicrobiales bacterium]|nr:acyl--CoA ligase [Acidimicrobiales bacterium]
MQPIGGDAVTSAPPDRRPCGAPAHNGCHRPIGNSAQITFPGWHAGAMLARIVDEAAQRFGDATAFVAADGWSLSFRQLAEHSSAAAVGLAQLGVRRGETVALVLPSIPEYVVAYAAANRLGAITAGINARLTAAERARLLELAEPRVIVATASLMPDESVCTDAARLEVEPATSATELFRSLSTTNSSSVLEAAAPTPPAAPDDPVALVFTSGTTGTPKGALFCNRQLEFITHVDTGNRWAERPGTPALAATSLAHLGPMTKLPGNLMRGTTTYFMRQWRATDALELIEKYRMPAIGGIPTQIALMLRDPTFDRRDLDCVKAIVIGGGPATPSLVRQARDRFGAVIAVRYSCTEAGIGVGTSFTDPPEDAELSVGRPHEGVELIIVDPDSLEPLPPGKTGEVCLRSPAVMSGYWHDPTATAAAFTPSGAVRTGDLGFVDDQGRLRLAGRIKEMYVRGGYNVFPATVEQVLAEHPGIAEVAVIPRNDEIMGEIGVAVVVPANPDQPPSLENLRSFARTQLAAHELPEAMVTVEAMPLTPMEKVDRRALLDMVARHD